MAKVQCPLCSQPRRKPPIRPMICPICGTLVKPALCPKCGADLAVWREVFKEEHSCPEIPTKEGNLVCKS